MRKLHRADDESAAARVIVFGQAKGGRLPRAGLFARTADKRLAEAAARAGLLTVRVPATAAQVWRKQVGQGGFGAKGALRLQAIRPRLFGELQAMYLAQRGRQRKAVSNSPDPEPSASSVMAPPENAGAPPPADIDLGHNLLAAYRLLDTAGIWFERVAAELADILERVGKSSELSFSSGAPWADDDDYTSGGTWVCNGWRWTFPARYQRVRTGALSFVIDIGKPGRPARVLGVPCALVAWSGIAHDWVRSIDSGTGVWPPPDDTVRLVANRLFQWTGKNARQWPWGGPALAGWCLVLSGTPYSPDQLCHAANSGGAADARIAGRRLGGHRLRKRS